jgi:hypothetical protein
VPIAVAVATGVGAGAGIVAIEGDLGQRRVGVGELVLVEEKERPHLEEGRHGALHGDERGDVGEARVDAAEACEDQGLVSHGLADVMEGVGEGLEAVAECGDGEVALDDGAELRLEVDSAGKLVVEEEVADEGVSLLRRLVLRHDDVEDVLTDGAIEPGADDEV